MCKKLSFKHPKPRPVTPKPALRPRPHRQPVVVPHVEIRTNEYDGGFELTSPSPSNFLSLRESTGRLEAVVEEIDKLVSPDVALDLGLDKTRARESILPIHLSCSEITEYSDFQGVQWLTSADSSKKVQFGMREDDFVSADHPVGCRNLSQTKVPQKSHGTGVSLRCSPDLKAQDAQSYNSSPGSQRPLTYPNNQGQLSVDPLICILTQPNIASKISGRVFMQTHF